MKLDRLEKALVFVFLVTGVPLAIGVAVVLIYGIMK